MSQAYSNLYNAFVEIKAIGSAGALLGWDQETMMPARGAQLRASSLAAIAKVIHEKTSQPQLGEWLDQCSHDSSLSETEKVNVREWMRDRNRIIKIPSSLAVEIAKTTSLAQGAWVEARKNDDTALFNPWLAKVLKLRREEASCIGFEENAYDAMLDQYEVGAKASALKPLFADLRESLHQLLDKILGSSKKPNLDFLSRSFPVAPQKIFNRKLLSEMTFNLEAGRLDESAHPFTSGIGPQDVRLTTRYGEKEFISAIFGTLHEGGHGLYEQGFLPSHFQTPMAEAVSLGIHESQSRLWENQVGRSLAYWKNYYPQLKELFPDPLTDVSLEQFYFGIHRVQPSLIRVEADEVTYNLHVILRFELEYQLFNQQLEVDSIEEAWNEGMQKLLGIRPDAPSNGYLQDVHWSAGLMGYFPTYTLGNLFSAQLFASAAKALPNLENQIESAHFHPLREWLRDSIHQHGRRYDSNSLVERVTGQEPDSKFLMDYLQTKYSALYDF